MLSACKEQWNSHTPSGFDKPHTQVRHTALRSPTGHVDIICQHSCIMPMFRKEEFNLHYSVADLYCSMWYTQLLLISHFVFLCIKKCSSTSYQVQIGEDYSNVTLIWELFCMWLKAVSFVGCYVFTLFFT